MAKSLLLTLSLVLAVGTVQASPNKYTTNTEEGNFKYGFQGGSSILYQRGGGFVEYKVHPKLGIQLGLFYDKDLYSVKVKDLAKDWAFVDPAHVTVPLTLCFYPGKDRQSCLFGGGELGYLVAGKFTLIKVAQGVADLKDVMQQAVEEFSKAKEEDKQDIKQREDKRNLAFRLNVGYSYEFKFGLFLGIRYTQGLNSVIEAETTYSNWALHFHGGWNIAGLINSFKK